MHVSAIVRAEISLFSDSSNNELFIINLATVPGRRNSKIPPAQSRKTLPTIMKQQFFFLILAILLSFTTQGQRLSFEKDSIANAIINLRRDTIIKGVSQTLTGTGTLISKGDKIYIVTASHVAKVIDSRGIVIIKGRNDRPISLHIKDFVEGNTTNWKIHPDADVAILELHPKQWLYDSGYLNNRFLPASIFYDTLQSVSRDIILTTFGFPLGLGTSGYFSPLTYRTFASSGLITLPRFDNKKLATFILLENPSVGGYSGGPVFDLGKIESGNIVMSSGTGTICYGLIHGTISDETGGKIAAMTPSYYIVQLLK